MKRGNWIRRAMALGLCITALSAQALSAKAAGMTQEDAFRAVFDAEYYYNTYTDLQTAIGMDEEALFSHFVNNGIREGRSGMADFNLRAYIQNNGDLMQTFGEDFAAYCEHYITSGRAEGRTALPGEGSDPGLGSYSSTYDVTQQRAVNVELAAQRINGVVLQPGEEFSFSRQVQSRTYENGYVLGPSYAAGREVMSVGGGICQVSSTLYVAMIRAGLPSTERWTHSAPVDYVPQGLDATIAEGTKDLKFVNVYAKPLVINATTQDGVLTVTLQFEETAS
ncbi:MAG TPA: VanW family protein [Candidatus Acetatifactor stercoripullorum]|uniref:VanW family protein n=1 Tax=Candidatus Acetatifactor stercoripullorum TaxID=2838414 RepID=A0A9D1UBK5_9FIRM|nr:VanW family protein [Candidatus Acetatifactor stercoripullorum]HIW81807.1 VanW family protein [Candidatus Acetatifactor stercoripullorum]